MTDPKQTAKDIIEKYKKTRMDILTTQDSIPCVMSDFPTTKTCKLLAIIHVNGIMMVLDGAWADVAAGEARDCQYINAHRKFWKDVLNEINKL